MRLTIAAIGRAKSGPEAALVKDYAKRLDALGRAVALGPLDLVELDARGKGAEAESALLLEKTSAADRLIVLDERGAALASDKFSDLLCNWRDDGARETAFLIGGADGHTAALRKRADRLLAFGPATWPHMLARAMLAEQLYRAISIAANHPYHRGG